jgi:hypothetical protein
MEISEMNDDLSFNMIGNESAEEFNLAEQEIIDSGGTAEETQEKIIDDEPDLSDVQVSGNQEGVDDGSQGTGGDINPAKDEDSPNFYTSVALSLKADNIFTLDESELNEVKDADALATVFKKQLDSLLTEQQKRVTDALNYGVPVEEVKQFENVISYLEGMDNESIKAETPEGDQLRGNLIYQDYINKGFSPERANKEVQKSLDAGTDVEDALEALTENKKFYKGQYDNILQQGKQSHEKILAEQKKRSKELEDKFLKTEEPIKGVKLTENERNKLYQQYTKFIDKDENGRPLNAIQKYAKENPIDYNYNVNVLFNLTNGFKDLGNVINKEVNKKTKSALSNLEKVIKNPGNNIGSGGFNFDNDNSKESYRGLNVDFS